MEDVAAELSEVPACTSDTPELTPYQKTPKVVMSPDGLAASLRVLTPSPTEEEPNFTAEQLLSFISQAGIIHGIDQSMIIKLADHMTYNVDHTIARGTPAVQGQHGYYEYLFERDFTTKPTIREDGSADFLSIKVMEVVHEGDLVVTYHPSIKGTPGISVKGKPIPVPAVRDLPPLGGRGFHGDDEGINYYASIDGKITLQNNRVIISPVLEIEGDADMTVGNIDFRGDILIHGGVKHGVSIHATGTITVEGLVENCTISAGRDIYFKRGVKGGEHTNVYAEGSITGEFMEYTNLVCKGDLRADVLFNCNVNCESRVIVTAGRRSAIIGGKTIGVLGVYALSLGNDFGTITDVFVGMDQGRMMEFADVTSKVESLENNIRKIKKGVADFDKANIELGNVNYLEDPRRMQLVRIKIQDEASVAQFRMRHKELQALFDVGKRATVKAYKRVNAGVNIHSTGHVVQMSDYQDNVEFERTETGIRMEPLGDVIEE